MGCETASMADKTGGKRQRLSKSKRTSSLGGSPLSHAEGNNDTGPPTFS